MLLRRLTLAASGALAIAALASSCVAAAESPPPFVTRGMPGEGHRAMAPLLGDWKVTITTYIAIGTPEKPATSSDIVAHREWIADGRFLRDVTQGTMAGSPYWRMGTLGYSNVDGRYEWVTQDGINAGMMIYQGAPKAGPHFPASMTGTFTDQGVLGERYAGKTIKQRTLIKIDGPDHHTIDLYFTPPGGKERLADRKEYTRIKQ